MNANLKRNLAIVDTKKTTTFEKIIIHANLARNLVSQLLQKFNIFAYNKMFYSVQTNICCRKLS